LLVIDSNAMKLEVVGKAPVESGACGEESDSRDQSINQLTSQPGLSLLYAQSDLRASSFLANQEDEQKTLNALRQKRHSLKMPKYKSRCCLPNSKPD